MQLKYFPSFPSFSLHFSFLFCGFLVLHFHYILVKMSLDQERKGDLEEIAVKRW